MYKKYYILISNKLMTNNGVSEKTQSYITIGSIYVIF